MVRFLSIASLLFSSYIALGAAESIPRVQANDVVAKLVGRATKCQSCALMASRAAIGAHQGCLDGFTCMISTGNRPDYCKK